ncbi:MAG: hypothetical protein K2Y39_22350 [Candidatus Obscuribacterales bacterium]|nr:hypothetical protein [Candidatus Obscuribacterales bacterium]
MDGKKLFIYGLFGIFGAVILSVLSAIGGAFGAGTALIVNALIDNVLIASITGGIVAALAFHSVIKGADKLFIKAAEKKAEQGNTGIKPPSLAADKRYLWGSVSYFVTTVIGVNLCHALLANPAWFIVATILGTGLLGVLGLGAVVSLKLWNPDFKKQNDPS